VLRAIHIASLAAMLAGSACAQHGMANDGTTVAFGDAYAGSLHRGVELPPDGDGYWVPKRWVRRGNQYGTDELVTMLVRVGRHLDREHGEPRLGVADLSPRGGGASAWHRSHQTGRDVDLLMFAIDGRGRSLPTDAMVRFKADGSSRRTDSHGKRRSRRYFDTARNWALVRALLEEHTVEVQYIYAFEPLKQALLEHAREIEEPAWLIAQADAVIEQPLDSSPHDDHFHVRIYCPRGDRALGCRDDDDRPWHEHLLYRWASVLARVRSVMVAVRIALLIPPA